MRCDEFERRLDAGIGAAGWAEALAHARGCASCAAALRVAETVDASLAALPPPAPAGFTSAVMSRIEALGRTAASPAGDAAIPPAPWWLVIGSEPAIWAGAVLATVIVALRTFTPELSSAITGITETAASAWTAAAWTALSRIPSYLPPLDPTQRSALAAGLALPLLWALYRAPLWLVESWSRRKQAASRERASHPRSPR